jgi:hypothetical protein
LYQSRKGPKPYPLTPLFNAFSKNWFLFAKKPAAVTGFKLRALDKVVNINSKELPVFLGAVATSIADISTVGLTLIFYDSSYCICSYLS